MKKHRKLKIVLAIILSVAFAVVLIMVPHMYIPKISDSLSISSHTSHQPDMVAHRGLSSLAPQNTVPAAELAVEYGYDGCEFDIHTTKDGEWVVIHNDTVDAMTNGSGEVSSFTLAELKELEIDSGNGIENYTDLKIPTLNEILEVLKDSDTYPVIEIKSCDTKLLPFLKQALENYGLKEKAKIISFDKEYLEKYRKIDREANLMLLINVVTPEDVEWCLENKVDTINFLYINLAKSLKGVQAAKEAGLSLAAWTVDNTVYKDVMVLVGVDTITTNKLIVSK